MNPYRVLIIDPDPTSTSFLSHEFKKAAFDVHTANSAKEGLILAYQHRPHVIIIDPVQKIVDYEDLLSKIHKDRRLTRTKVFAFSSLQNPADIQQAINLGFDEYLAKEGHALSKLIDMTTRAGQQARQPAEAQASSGTVTAEVHGPPTPTTSRARHTSSRPNRRRGRACSPVRPIPSSV